jgi:uncharacterized protein YkwD
MKSRLIYRSLLLILLFAAVFMENCKVQSGLSEGEAEQKVFRLVNDHRLGSGLSRLEWNDAIAGQGRSHSRDMASGAVPFGHDGFDQRLANIRALVSLSLAGENLALISEYPNPAEMALQKWLSSQNHLENIEGDFNLTGVGVAKKGDNTYYITQIFILSTN